MTTEIRVGLFVIAALVLLVGCQIPGGSFGQEPLQTRFAALTKVAIQAEPQTFFHGGKSFRHDFHAPLTGLSAAVFPASLHGHSDAARGSNVIVFDQKHVM